MIRVRVRNMTEEKQIQSGNARIGEMNYDQVRATLVQERGRKQKPKQRALFLRVEIGTNSTWNVGGCDGGRVGEENVEEGEKSLGTACQHRSLKMARAHQRTLLHQKLLLLQGTEYYGTNIMVPLDQMFREL